MTWWQWAIWIWCGGGAALSLAGQLIHGGACYTFCLDSPVARRLHPVGIVWSIIYGAIYGPIGGIMSLLFPF
jgi:hypothetical protein